MAAPPITVQLTKFEQIEILRAEIGSREEEMRKTESQIREVLFEIERQKYLQTLHPLFAKLQPPQDVANLPHLQTYRETLRGAIQIMEAALAALEKETAGQMPPGGRGQNRPGVGAAGAAGPRRKFDSFDDFRANKPPGT